MLFLLFHKIQTKLKFQTFENPIKHTFKMTFTIIFTRIINVSNSGCWRLNFKDSHYQLNQSNILNNCFYGSSYLIYKMMIILAPRKRMYSMHNDTYG